LLVDECIAVKARHAKLVSLHTGNEDVSSSREDIEALLRYEDGFY
jgi:hypothetical protein